MQTLRLTYSETLLVVDPADNSIRIEKEDWYDDEEDWHPGQASTFYLKDEDRIKLIEALGGKAQ